MIMDSLRYWVTEMHVDGFRFDLAATLARQFHEVDRLSAFFDLVQQDPTVSQVKLIAEPWDIGDGGYQVGNFPPLWTEWNGKYRDTVRDFWRGESRTVPEFASRLTGSSDLYAYSGRRPYASINFVTAHDGFTLADLVSYNDKHNEANGEDNKDGENHNRSWNCGVEGPTERRRDPRSARAAATQLPRRRSCCRKAYRCCSHGDEMGRTQHGNNNAYCQDNELSWVDWSLVENNADLVDFTSKLTQLRRDHPVFRRRRFFTGVRGSDDLHDVAWFDTDGELMDDEDWENGLARTIGDVPQRRRHHQSGPSGQHVVDDSFLLLFNAYESALEFIVPAEEWGKRWVVEFDTAENPNRKSANQRRVTAGKSMSVEGRSAVLLRRLV